MSQILTSLGCLLTIFLLTSLGIPAKEKIRHVEWNRVTEGASVLTMDSHAVYKFSWQQTDTSVALLNHEKIVWQFNFDQRYDKPYFHPLRTAKGGFDLTWNRPADHTWHRGLWFSWKIINGVNYWEEDSVSRLSDGRSKIETVSLALNKDFSATITLKLSYATASQEKVLDEDRTIFVSAPDLNGNYYIDWNLKFRAGAVPVVFERTLPQKMGGPFYGGYAGLSFRAAESMEKHRYMDSKGWQRTAEVVGHGMPAQWMDLSGSVDPRGNVYAGVSILDHPANENSPVPWYVYKDKKFAFYNAALLFNKPISLQPAANMRLMYRVLVHEGLVSAATLVKEQRQFMNKYSVEVGMKSVSNQSK